MRVWTAVFLLMVSGLALAEDRVEKVREIMEAQGLFEMFDQQLTAGREHCRQQADQVMEKMLSQLIPSAEVQAQFRQAASDFINAAQGPWTAGDMVDVWSKYYGAKFSDEQLDELLKYYRSPLGKKEVLASHEAAVQFREESQQRYEPVLSKATDDFIRRLQGIVAKCNCEKTPGGHQTGTNTQAQ